MDTKTCVKCGKDYVGEKCESCAENCEHLNIVATETYGVQGSYDPATKKYLVKQGDGGLDEGSTECEDCGMKLPEAELEFCN